MLADEEIILRLENAVLPATRTAYGTFRVSTYYDSSLIDSGDTISCDLDPVDIAVYDATFDLV